MSINIITESVHTDGRVFYHGSDRAFLSFEHSNDIGFHFGGREAANYMLEKMGCSKPVIEVSSNTLNLDYLKAANILSNGVATSLVEVAFCVMAPRLDQPTGLMEKLSPIDDQEIKALIEEYSKKPLHLKFINTLQVIHNTPLFKIFYNDTWISTAHSKEQANHIVKALKTQPVKEAHLSISQAVRLPDLGTWPPRSIAKEIGLDSADMLAFNDLESDDERYDFLRRILQEHGVNAIVYKNMVESPDADSIIMLEAKDIRLLNAAYPKAHPNADSFAELFNQMDNSLQLSLEPEQHISSMRDSLKNAWSGVEDFVLLRGNIHNTTAFDILLQEHFNHYTQKPALKTSRPIEHPQKQVTRSKTLSL